jgi:hypothetical protein
MEIKDLLKYFNPFSDCSPWKRKLTTSRLLTTTKLEVIFIFNGRNSSSRTNELKWKCAHLSTCKINEIPDLAYLA